MATTKTKLTSFNFNPKWHATLKGTLPSAREVVLIHEAV